jgi:hypothetical protein
MRPQRSFEGCCEEVLRHGVPLLVLVNKQDRSNALSVAEAEAKLRLPYDGERKVILGVN